MNRFDMTETPLADLFVVRRQALGDERGFLERVFCRRDLAELLHIDFDIAQINRTYTAACGAVRGLHFQYPPHAETKLVSCTRGAVFDVAVDLRKGSSTFLEWYGERLSADNHASLLIPPGFAHGFQTLEPDVEMLYLHSAYYQPDSEGGVNVNDPALNIDWPAPTGTISERDHSFAFLTSNFEGIQS